MSHPRVLLATLGLLGLSLTRALPAQGPDSSLVTLERLFDSDEFTPDLLGPVRWLDGEPAYTRLEPDRTPPGGPAPRFNTELREYSLGCTLNRWKP